MTKFYERVLKCSDCGEDFVFTAGEASFYAEKHFMHRPKRCRFCRTRNKVSGVKQDTRSTEIECSSCGKTDTVPFQPTQGRAVFCKECFNQRTQISKDGKKFRSGNRTIATTSKGENMNTESTKVETTRIYNRLTTGAFFSQDDRHQTKHIVEKVLNSIVPKLEKGQREILLDLEIC